MKNSEKIILALILVAALVLPLTVFALSTSFVTRQVGGWPLNVSVQRYNGAVVRLPGADALQGPDGDQLVLGSTYELESGETLEGSLVVIGGTATLQAGSRVAQDVVLMGGTLQSQGTIDGDVVTLGGAVELGESAVVKGDVNVISGNLKRAEGARIEGRVNRSVNVYTPTPVTWFWMPGVNGGILGQSLLWLLKSILWGIVALLVVLVLPQHSERARAAVVERTGISAGLGLLTIVIAPLLLVVMAITIIGIPVTVFGVFALALAWAFGVIVIGLEVGKRLVQMAKQEWAPAVAAALGTFLVTLVGNAIGLVVPCIGWLAPAVVGMVGLGAVLMTRFGSQDYPNSDLPHPSAPQPVAPAPFVETPPAPEAPADAAEEKAAE